MKVGCGTQERATSEVIPLPVIKKSKVSKWRAAALIAVNLFMAAHIIHWWVAGKTVSPIEPSEAMHTLERGELNAGFIFFSLAILSTLILGRFFCGWGCHILSLQDFCSWILKKIGVTPKPFRSRLLIYVPILAALYMFVWPSVYRLFADPKVTPSFPGFSNHLMTENFWATFPPLAVAIPFLFICGFLTVYFLGSKGYCTYACPYGGFFGLADKFAPGKIRVTDACNQCGHCTAVCTSNVRVHLEVKEHKMVVDPGCMKCMDCVSVCPNDALYFGFGKSTYIAPKVESTPKAYSIAWPEEIFAGLVFLGSFLAVRSAYGIVPFLMALGWAAVSTFVALMTWRTLKVRDLSLYRFILKSGGRVTVAGGVFLLFSFPWLALTAHSGVMRWEESLAQKAFEGVLVPDELALADPKVKVTLSEGERKAIESARAHYQFVDNWGLFSNSENLSRLGWLLYLDGDPKQASESLLDAARRQPPETRALSLYYCAAIENNMDQHALALRHLDEALRLKPDLVLAYQEKGNALWLLGRRKEAIDAWDQAVSASPDLPLALSSLSGAYSELGRVTDANEFAARANRATPKDPLFHWMLGLKLKSLGMKYLSDRHFNIAIELDPSFAARKK